MAAAYVSDDYNLKEIEVCFDVHYLIIILNLFLITTEVQL